MNVEYYKRHLECVRNEFNYLKLIAGLLIEILKELKEKQGANK